MEMDMDLINEFVAEAKEHLQSIEEDFLELERTKDNPDADLVNKVFRAIHTIKGSSGFFGLKNITELAHVMETLLSQIRAGEKRPESEYVDVLLDGVDLLNEMINDIENSENVDTKETYIKIQSIIDGKMPNEIPKNIPPKEKEKKVEEIKKKKYKQFIIESSNYGEIKFDIDDFDKNNIPKEQKYTYLLSYNLNQLEKEKNITPIQLFRDLSGTGTIITSVIDIEGDLSNKKESPLLLHVIYTTVLDPNFVLEAVYIDEENIKEIQLASIFSIEEEIDESIKNISLNYKDKNIDFKISNQIINNIPQDQKYFYLIYYDMNDIEKNNYSIKDVISELMKTGTIISYNQDENSLYIIYSSVLDPSFIEEALNFIKFEMSTLNKDALKENINQTPNKETENSKNETKSKTPTKKEADPKTKQHSQSMETVRIRLDILDKLMMLAGELVLVRNQQLIKSDMNNPTIRTIVQRLDLVTTELQETIMFTRMQPLGNILTKFNRIVRDLGKSLKKDMELIIKGNEVELDKTILEGLSDPLTHIIRNSCDHGIELPDEREKNGKPRKGTIKIDAFHEGGQINIVISDDGKGLNAEKLKKKAIEKNVITAEEAEGMDEKTAFELIFKPGFSTAEKISDVSGRGVGMDVVKSSIEKLGGNVEIISELGKGTTLKIRLPLTLAIIPSLIVMVNGNRFAIPQVNLEELVALYDKDIYEKIEFAGNREVYRLRESLLPIVHAKEILENKNIFDEDVKTEIVEKYRIIRKEQHEKILNGEITNAVLNFIVLRVGNIRYGLVIDKVIGTEEIVVKPMHRVIKSLDIYSGATVLGDGQVALILDSFGIAKHAGISGNEDFKSDINEDELDTNLLGETRDLLLFDNLQEEQFAINLNKIKRIEKINFNKIEHIGGNEYITIDGISTAIVRLENYLNVSPTIENEEMFLILPSASDFPYGILISNLIDIGNYALTLNYDSYQNETVEATSIINDKMTLLLIMEKFEEYIKAQVAN